MFFLRKETIFWHLSFMLFDFVFKKPYSWNFFNLSNMVNVAVFQPYSRIKFQKIR